MSREAAAERNKQQAATLRIASKHLGGITENGTDMFSEVKFRAQLASFLSGFTLQDLQICTVTDTTTAVGKSGKDKVVRDDNPSTQTNREGDMPTVIYT